MAHRVRAQRFRRTTSGRQTGSRPAGLAAGQLARRPRGRGAGNGTIGGRGDLPVDHQLQTLQVIECLGRWTFASHPIRTARRGRRRGPARPSRRDRFLLLSDVKAKMPPSRSSCRRPLPPGPPGARPRRAARMCGSGPRTSPYGNRHAMELLDGLGIPRIDSRRRSRKADNMGRLARSARGSSEQPGVTCAVNWCALRP